MHPNDTPARRRARRATWAILVGATAAAWGAWYAEGGWAASPPDVGCESPPPAAVRAAAVAADLVTRRVMPTTAPTLCMDSAVGAGEGGYMAGWGMLLPLDDRRRYAVPAARWDPNEAGTMLHETLHHAASVTGNLPIPPHMRPEEEGVTEAVTQDLFPEYRRRLGSRDRLDPGEYPVAYPGWTTTARLRSARATGCPWTSPAARRWRARFLMTPYHLRPPADARAQTKPRHCY